MSIFYYVLSFLPWAAIGNFELLSGDCLRGERSSGRACGFVLLNMNQTLPERSRQSSFQLDGTKFAEQRPLRLFCLHAHGYPHASRHSNMLQSKLTMRNSEKALSVLMFSLVLVQLDSRQIALLVTLVISHLV